MRVTLHDFEYVLPSFLNGKRIGNKLVWGRFRGFGAAELFNLFKLKPLMYKKNLLEGSEVKMLEYCR